MCNCFSANNTTNSVFVVVSSCYCYCQLYSYIVKHTHTHTQHILSCMLYVVDFFGGRLHSIGKHRSPRRVCDWNWRRFGHWTVRGRGRQHVATAATAAQLAADSCRNICPAKDSACHIREGKSKTRNSRDFTIYLYVCIFFEACNKIKFINSQRQRREEELQPPTRQIHNSFSGRAKLSRVCECVCECLCVWVCVHSFKKIHSHSQFACVKQVLAWLPLLSPPSLSLSLAVACVNLCASRFLIFEND